MRSESWNVHVITSLIALTSYRYFPLPFHRYLILVIVSAPNRCLPLTGLNNDCCVPSTGPTTAQGLFHCGTHPAYWHPARSQGCALFGNSSVLYVQYLGHYLGHQASPIFHGASVKKGFLRLYTTLT